MVSESMSEEFRILKRNSVYLSRTKTPEDLVKRTSVAETHKVDYHWLMIIWGYCYKHTKKSDLFKQNMRHSMSGFLSRTVRHQFGLKQELLKSNARILP